VPGGLKTRQIVVGETGLENPRATSLQRKKKESALRNAKTCQKRGVPGDESGDNGNNETGKPLRKKTTLNGDSRKNQCQAGAKQERKSGPSKEEAGRP